MVELEEEERSEVGPKEVDENTVNHDDNNNNNKCSVCANLFDILSRRKIVLNLKVTLDN